MSVMDAMPVFQRTRLMEGCNFTRDAMAYENKIYVPIRDTMGKVVKSAWDQRNEAIMRNYGDASYVINSNTLTTLKTQILEVLQSEPVSQFSFDAFNIGAGRRYYTWLKNNVTQKPRQTNTFSGGEAKGVNTSVQTATLYGMDYDIEIDKPTIDAGNSAEGSVYNVSPSPQNNHLTELMRSLVQAREWWIWRGASSPGMTGAETGFINDTGITTSSVSDTDWTTVGDSHKNLVKMATDLIQAKFKPPFTIYVTPKVLSQMVQNINTTSGFSDYYYVINTESPSGTGKMFDGVKLCPYLIASETETTSTGAAAVVKKLPENFVAESYAPGVYPLVSTDLGWKAKMLWMGHPVLMRPTAITYKGTLTTNT